MGPASTPPIPDPDALYTVARVRAAEARAIDAVGGRTLMCRAGEAIARHALSIGDGPFLVLAGPGNNGGDAFDAAYTLHHAHREVCVVEVSGPRRSADASDARARCVAARVPIVTAWPADARPACVIDGLFGIGLSRAIDGPARALVEQALAFGAPVLAIDVPTGIDADTGAVIGGTAGIALRAAHTVTLIANKPGLYTGTALDHCGHVHVESLGCGSFLEAPDGACIAPRALDLASLRRRTDSHKGSYGTVTIVGGAPTMVGAALLAARGALFAGAGRVMVALLDSRVALDPQHPEVLIRAARETDLTRGPVVAGPGLGDSDAAVEILTRAIDGAPTLVLDADALNLVAHTAPMRSAVRERTTRGRATIVTPHPLEAARLLDTTTERVQYDRIAAARAIAQSLQAIVVLKGAGTVVADPGGRWWINPTGNPALATGGTGDVLAGVTGALCAVLEPQTAALLAPWLHGAAADDLVAAGVGPIGATAGELLPALRTRLNRCVPTRQGAA